MVASVPELTRRTSSTEVRLMMSCASATSPMVGAPKDSPSTMVFCTASSTAGWACPMSMGPQEQTRSTYSLPSTSMRMEPWARSMNRAWPPTEPKALTGEFTPPGVNILAFSNHSMERETLAEVPDGEADISTIVLIQPHKPILRINGGNLCMEQSFDCGLRIGDDGGHSHTGSPSSDGFEPVNLGNLCAGPGDGGDVVNTIVRQTPEPPLDKDLGQAGGAAIETGDGLEIIQGRINQVVLIHAGGGLVAKPSEGRAH